MSNKQPRYLTEDCELGTIAKAYWIKKFSSKPTHMRITGDGFIAFGWRIELPSYTQEIHFKDSNGNKFDAGENSISIITIVRDYYENT